MTALVVAIVIIVVLALAAGAFFVLGRRDTSRAIGTLSAETTSRDRAARKASRELAQTQGDEVEQWRPPTLDEIGASRRQFLNRGILVLTGLGVAGFGTGLISYLWPSASGGFGSKISLGKIADLKEKIAAGNGQYYVPEGKLFLTTYPPSALAKARAVYQPSQLAAMEEGISVLYQKCPHLGCRVPWCDTSHWFECPCHGSQYNAAGEKKSGPAPRGMDHFASTVTGGTLTADTGTIIQGAPIGTDTTGQEAAGPHCVSGGE